MLGVMTPSGSSVGESRRGSAMPYTPPAFPPSYPMTGRQMSSMSGTSAAAYGMMGAAASNGNGTSSESSSPRSSMFPHLGEGISGVAEEGVEGRSEEQPSPQARPHTVRSKKKRSSHARSSSPRSASSAMSPEAGGLPVVPMRRSSARTASSPEDVDDLPSTSPPLSSEQSQSAGHRLAESSDTSDYGSQADADEDEGLRRVTVDAGTVEVGSSSAGDYSNVLQLAGGPPKLQRPQRGPPSADSGSASRRDQLASPSSGSASLESHHKSPPAAAMARSLSPRKPRVEPGMERQRSVPPPQQQQQQQSSAPTAPTHSSTDSAEAALEAAAIRDADLEDPNRPRTLKEARELAKARAKAREESLSLAPSSGSKRFGQISPKTSTEAPNGGDTVNSADSAMDELQAAVGSALDDLDFSQPADESFGNTSGTISVPGDWLPHDRAVITEDAVERSSVDMAYDSAREFDDDEAGADGRGHAAPAARGHQEVSPSVASALSEDGRQVSFDSSSSSTSIRMLRQRSGRSDDGAVVDGQKFMKGGLRNVPERPGALSLAQALELSAPPSPATPQADWNTPRAIPKRMASAAQFNESAAPTPKLVQGPPRTAPPTRIDVPGKTVPFPPAFHVSAISVDKRRAPPWERAKAYANFTNELCSIPSGLSLWIEAASRRPIPQSSSNNSKASLMPGNGPRLPSSLSPTVARSANSGGDGSFTHPRDVSGASVRSDQTFPIRGDGGKARDITQIPLDTSQPDAYPGAVPSSIPYPSLVPQAPTRSLSSSTGASIKPASMTMTSSASSAGSQSLVGLRARKISSSALDALNAFSGGSSANNTSPTMGRERPSGSFSRPAVLGGGGASVTSPQSSSSSSSSSGPPRAGGGGIFSSLGRRNSKRTMTASSSSQSFASAGSGANNSGSSGPRGPRIPGAAGALGRAIGNVHRHGGTGAPAVGSNAVGSSIDLGAMARNPETANAGLAMMPPRNSTSAVQQGSVESPTTPTPQTVNAATTGSVSGPRGPRAPGTLRNSPSVQMLNASASPATGGVAAPTFIPSYPSGGPGGNASPPKKLSALPQAGGSAVQQQQQRPTDYARTGSGNGSGNGNGGRTPTTATATATTPMEERPDFKEALRKLVDVLPDADEDVLSGYLRRAAGNDLRAIGDYLGDQAKGSLKR